MNVLPRSATDDSNYLSIPSSVFRTLFSSFISRMRRDRSSKKNTLHPRAAVDGEKEKKDPQYFGLLLLTPGSLARSVDSIHAPSSVKCFSRHVCVCVQQKQQHVQYQISLGVCCFYSVYRRDAEFEIGGKVFQLLTPR